MARDKVELHFEDFRAIHKGEPGYSDTKRRYISESSGEVISIRQFQKGAHGGKSYEQRVAERPTPQKTEMVSGGSEKGASFGYKKELELYTRFRNEQLRKDGLPPLKNLKEARESAEFKAFYKSMKSKDNSKDGRKAKALVDLGLRDADADYPVGETPPAE